MKAWNFKVKNNPTEISKKLEITLGSDNGFLFDTENDENNSITFKIRKRILYVWYWAFQNWTIITGKLIKTDTEDMTNVEISFNQHFLIRLIIFTYIFLGLGLLIAIISGISNNTSMYIFGGATLLLGIILWFAMQSKYTRDVEKYKTLISEILKS